MKANCGKRLGNKKDEIQMYINIKWCTGGKNNYNSIYKTTGSELNVTIWNVRVVTDCAVKMSVRWSVAIKKINCVQELLGENREQNRQSLFPPTGGLGGNQWCKLRIPGALRLLWVRREDSWRAWICAWLWSSGCRLLSPSPTGLIPPGEGTGLALCRCMLCLKDITIFQKPGVR